MNKVLLIGRLGKDPEIRYAANGSPVANLRIATDESYTDREGNKVDRTEWHTVVVFQRQAENCKTYLTKGSLVFVEGSLQTRKWQDQQGQDRYSTEVKASRVQFLDRKSQQHERSQSEQQKSPVGKGDGYPRGVFTFDDISEPATNPEASLMDLDIGHSPQQHQPNAAFPMKSEDMDMLPWDKPAQHNLNIQSKPSERDEVPF